MAIRVFSAGCFRSTLSPGTCRGLSVATLSTESARVSARWESRGNLVLSQLIAVDRVPGCTADQTRRQAVSRVSCAGPGQRRSRANLYHRALDKRTAYGHSIWIWMGPLVVGAI